MALDAVVGENGSDFVLEVYCPGITLPGDHPSFGRPGPEIGHHLGRRETAAVNGHEVVAAQPGPGAIRLVSQEEMVVLIPIGGISRNGCLASLFAIEVDPAPARAFPGVD